MDKHIVTKFSGVDEGLGLILGFAIICKEDGEDHFDLQGDHIPEDTMFVSTTDFMLKSREARTMHGSKKTGDVVFAFPLTTEVAKAFGIVTKFTGLMVGVKPSDPADLEKARNGTFTGFSIGGYRGEDEDVE